MENASGPCEPRGDQRHGVNKVTTKVTECQLNDTPATFDLQWRKDPVFSKIYQDVSESVYADARVKHLLALLLEKVLVENRVMMELTAIEEESSTRHKLEHLSVKEGKKPVDNTPISHDQNMQFPMLSEDLQLDCLTSRGKY